MTFSHPSDQKQFHQRSQIGIYLLTALLGAALTLAIIRIFPKQFIPQDVYPNPEMSASVPTASVSKVAAVTVNQQNFVVAAIKRVGAAVVRIDTERTVTPRLPPWFDDPFWRPFFGRNTIPELPQFRLYGEGSGFIIEADGLILTNAHVVSGADTVNVTLKDGRNFQGKVLGIDQPFDLAVVKIEGTNLPVAPLGNSDNVQVGDWAIAVGNPFGLDNTVTLGIISTLKRSSSQVGIPGKPLDFIQTDAAINPGNSGGPLLNEQGEVIGINTAIRAQAEGIGFAIPINTAKAVKDTLARGEKIPHPYMGISMATLTPQLAKGINTIPYKNFTVPEVQGVVIIQVLPNTPAESAGLERGDVIVQVNGQAVTSAEQLQDIVAKSSVGQSLQLKVRRGKQVQQLSVALADLNNIKEQE
ncbi:MAG: HhoA/HhoB/HtrA family serine endopeptidase [Nostocaceae cyanobacterium]|nr:HhoA/HhoB/HtrA family serine endopeptidase [Nostocaceae cyanobacterium]